MIILLYILLFITDGLINNANTIILSITLIHNMTYEKDIKYYLLLIILGLLTDIIFTQTLLINTLIFPIIGYIITHIYKRLKESIFTNILSMTLSIIIHKILMYLLIFISTGKSVNVLSTLINILIINIPIMLLLNTKEIIISLRRFILRKMPKTIGVRVISADLKLNKKRKQNKEKFIILIIAILSIIGIIYKTKNEEVINTSINNNDLIKTVEVVKNNNAYDNINPNINGNTINFNINFEKIESSIEYKINIKNTTNETINLKDYKLYPNKYNIKVDLVDINNIIILPNNEKEFKLKLKYLKNDLYNLPINNANINVELIFNQ